MSIVALDTETTLIPDRAHFRSKSGARIYTAPYETPDLVCGSFQVKGVTEMGQPQLYNAVDTVRWVKELLPEHTLVLHHACFDLDVLIKAGVPEELVLHALEAGRIWDTMLLDMLIGLARGRYEAPRWVRDQWVFEEFRAPTLDTLARRYAGMELDKDKDVRLTFGQYRDCFDKMPERHRTYAMDDAVATMRVFSAQRSILNQAAWGSLDHARQLQAAWALYQLDKRGVAIDRELALKLQVEFSKYLDQPRHDLVAAGLGSWEAEPGTAKRFVVEAEPGGYWPQLDDGIWYFEGGETPAVRKIRRFKTRVHEWISTHPKFKLNTKTIQRRLEPVAKVLHKRAPRRKDGTLSLDYDFWHEHAPARDEALQTWLEHEKIKKVLTTYLDVYAQCDQVFARWRPIGAKTTRVSAAAPSVMNVPKRRLGIRSLFRARPGHKFVIADYSAQELFTLAQTMLDKGIKGPLLRACRAFDGGRGPDLHKFGAAILLEKPIEEVTKDERQGQKVLHFGVPGGLGAAKLAEYAWKTYGVKWSPAEAKAKRDLFLQRFPDIAEYLRSFNMSRHAALMAVTGKGESFWRSELGIEEWNTIREMLRYPDPDIQEIAERADRQQISRIRTGGIRGYCRYTEASNFGFQGLAAAVSKEALWLCEMAKLRTVLFCHDELVVESTHPEYDQLLLKELMLLAFKAVCPDVGHYAAVESKVSDTWGPTTDITGEIMR